jgi:hypothetical protein
MSGATDMMLGIIGGDGDEKMGTTKSVEGTAATDGGWAPDAELSVDG